MNGAMGWLFASVLAIVASAALCDYGNSRIVRRSAIAGLLIAFLSFFAATAVVIAMSHGWRP